MKKIYNHLAITLTAFQTEDIVCASPVVGTDDNMGYIPDIWRE